MREQTLFLLNSIMLGTGLAMDAFSVSVTGGLAEPEMPVRRGAKIAGTFAGFQFLMPLAGWFCVSFALRLFRAVERLIPWIALILLVVIGGRMLREGLRQRADDTLRPKRLKDSDLFFLGIATSIDALSVGFAVAEYGAGEAVFCAAVIGIVTFIICLGGAALGSRFSAALLRGRSALAWLPSAAGGVILILIGIEIFFR